jgi:hypothetical protein
MSSTNNTTTTTSTNPPPSGDGTSPETSTWSSALFLAPNTTPTFVVDALGLLPRYRRTTLEEARSAAQVYTVLDGNTYQAVQQLPAGPMANPSLPAATGEAQQIAEIAEQESVIAASGGDAAEQYNASQVHRGFFSLEIYFGRSY